MSNVLRSACSLDCFDACGILVTVEEGKVIKVVGDPDHPITKGYICHKGRAHLDRMYSQDRLLKPFKKVSGKFVETSWEDAIDLITTKMKETIEANGTQSIIHIYDCGYSGISKSVDTMFFNHLGGISTSSAPGSLCWKAGNVAQKLDFGTSKGHSADDLANSKLMIIWGRNPAATNIHFMQAIKDVKKKGGEVVCIDPFKTQTAKLSTWHLPVKPGGDGALAMAMARIIIDKGLVNEPFIRQHSLGFEAYKNEVMQFDMAKAEDLTGLAMPEIERLAIKYASVKPASIILGYGMQRYVNGGQNVRTIDALGALTGNIGVSGGGVTYSNKSISKHVAGYVDESEVYAKQARYYKPAKVAHYMNTTSAPQIKFAWIAKSNPVVQAPDTNEMIKALRKTDFVVVVDMFMTDTAKEADLVLPATSIFEEEDFIYSSMYSPYLCYAQRCVIAPEDMIGEYELFQILAKKMNLETYPNIPREAFFKHALNPLMETFQLDYESLQRKPYAIPNQNVPWADRNFETPSGKFEFESEVAQRMGLNKVISLVEGMGANEMYPYRLVTPHDIRSTNSQHFRNYASAVEVFIPVEDAKALEINMDDKVLVRSKHGQIIGLAKPDGHMPIGVVKIMEGTWCNEGAVNKLIGDQTCDYGDQAAYYDTFINLSKIDFDK